MSTLFISDLHLDEGLPQLTAAFEQFMARVAPKASHLYILGDFFEVWVGDDDRSDFNLHIASLCRNYVEQGSKLSLMVGNRDFLMGEAFAALCGATLLSDPTLINLNGTPTLLMHGDSLCTQDAEYMAFRQQSRSPEWQQQMLSQSLEARKAFAAQARQKSQSHNRMQADDIMDVTPAEVTKVMAEQGATRLIHGHTHRPARHTLPDHCERIVLGDWGDSVWWLEAGTNGELSLEQRQTTEFLPG